jgi:hypothetical protein
VARERHDEVPPLFGGILPVPATEKKNPTLRLGFSF